MNTPAEIQTFTDREFINDLSNALKEISDNKNFTDENRMPVENSYCAALIDLFITERENIENLCDYSKWLISAALKQHARKLSRSGERAINKENIERLLYLLYVVVCELDYKNIGSENFQRSTIAGIRRAIDSFSPDLKANLMWASYMFPAQIVKNQIQDHRFQELLKLPSEIGRGVQLKKDLEADIKKIGDEQVEMKKFLSDIKANYNFAVLTEGFSGLRLTKNRELFWAKLVLIAIGLVMILFPVMQVSLFLWGGDGNGGGLPKKYAESALYIAPPLIALELLILYFFRITLLNFRSIKAQLLQLDLRIALCQFVQAYTKYSVGIKPTDRSGIEKFESLIFSGIAADNGGIPTTFDGLSEVAKVIQSLNGTGKKAPAQ